MSVKEFKAHITKSNKEIKEYKEYLVVCKGENMDYYQASKTIMEYLHPNDKLTVKDYEEINKLRKWYNELEE